MSITIAPPGTYAHVNGDGGKRRVHVFAFAGGVPLTTTLEGDGESLRLAPVRGYSGEIDGPEPRNPAIPAPPGLTFDGLPVVALEIDYESDGMTVLHTVEANGAITRRYAEDGEAAYTSVDKVVAAAEYRALNAVAA